MCTAPASSHALPAPARPASCNLFWSSGGAPAGRWPWYSPLGGPVNRPLLPRPPPRQPTGPVAGHRPPVPRSRVYKERTNNTPVLVSPRPTPPPPTTLPRTHIYHVGPKLWCQGHGEAASAGPCWHPATLKGGLGAGTHPLLPQPPSTAWTGGGHLQGCCEARRQGQTVWRMVPGRGHLGVLRRVCSPGSRGHSWGFPEVCSKCLPPPPGIPHQADRPPHPGLCLHHDRCHYAYSSPTRMSHLREEPARWGVGGA